jgi:hypothetical protein
LRLVIAKVLNRGMAYDPKKRLEPCGGQVAAIRLQPLGEVIFDKSEVKDVSETGYDKKLDAERLGKQLEVVRGFMVQESFFGGWRTLAEIARNVSYPEASISARLRDLRRLGYVVDKRRRGEPKRGLFEYRVSKPAPQEAQPSLFKVHV